MNVMYTVHNDCNVNVDEDIASRLRKTLFVTQIQLNFANEYYEMLLALNTLDSIQ